MIAALLSQAGQGGLPGMGKGGGLPTQVVGGRPPMTPPITPPPGKVPEFAAGQAAPGQMPMMRDAMMQNVLGMLRQPNFGVPRFAGLGAPPAPQGPPAGMLPPAQIPVASGGMRGGRGPSLYARA